MPPSNHRCGLLGLCTTIALVASALAQDDADSPLELLKNGAANSLEDWRTSQCTLDTHVGRTEKGSFKIHSNARGGLVYQIIELKKNSPSRLKFSAHVKTRDFESFASVRLLAALMAKDQPMKYVFGEFVQEDTSDWKELSLVFDLPRGYTKVRPMASLNGKGTAWLDDLSLRASDDPVTPRKIPRPAEHAHWDWIRNSAESIPWSFDLIQAQRDSAKQDRPVLIYVRCIDHGGDQLESAKTSLRADRVWATDNGFAKDVLFRTGVLADDEVSKLIRARFIPVLYTYRFSQEWDQEIVNGVTRDDAVTPALIVLAPDGKVAGRLHRIGLISVDLIDHWLRAVLDQVEFSTTGKSLAELFDAGELEELVSNASDQSEQHQLLRAKSFRRLGKLAEAEKQLDEIDSPEAQFERSLLSIRRGDWQKAIERLDGAEADDRTCFMKAWCLHRLGRRDDAEEIWKQLAADTDVGRRAALCLLPEPKLWLAGSQLAWPRQTKLDDQSESALIEFDPARSIRRLLELQRPDGSWGWHRNGPLWTQAITAIAAEALWQWRSRLEDNSLVVQIEAAHARAVDYLVEYAHDAASTRIDVFVAPYVLEYLLQLERIESATLIVKKLVSLQLPDGSWSYRDDAPTSFNTAHVLIALHDASARGIDVPKESVERGTKALAAMRAESGVFPYAPPRGFQWMTTEHASIARDPLCETALLMGESSDQANLQAALMRFTQMAHELRKPTKAYSGYFNKRGHGSYFFFYAHHHALRAAGFLEDQKLRSWVLKLIRREVLNAQEYDGTFIDHFLYGRSYGTAMALLILSEQ